MKIQFEKYQGTGNDFILIDDRKNQINLTTEQIETICNRRFGIGADGLMLLRFIDGYDFEMKYYNSDGNESTMCGNGGRCIAAFAKQIGVIKNNAHFLAIDGPHKAIINKDETVSLGMIDVANLQNDGDSLILFTGSPHYVAFTEADLLNSNNFEAEASNIRNNETYAEKGINVNFVKVLAEGQIAMRTFERGVEAETYSCGTGAVAAAISYHKKYKDTSEHFNTAITTRGGKLRVSFNVQGGYKQIELTGPAKHVFEGVIEI